MRVAALFLMMIVWAIVIRPMLADVKPFSPVTQQTLEQPRPDDRQMFSRTYDARRLSPLNQIHTENVGLALAWARGFDQGLAETVPLAHDGAMYIVVAGDIAHMAPELVMPSAPTAIYVFALPKARDRTSAGARQSG